MREIKFRGWDDELKKWHYGNYYFYTDTIYCFASEKDHEENEHHCILFDGFCDWNMPRPHYKAFVNKNTIGQYTGLKDKNGVEIYEGDILLYTDNFKVNGTTSHTATLEWNEDLNGFYLKAVGFGFYSLNSQSILRYNIEVIGNIHEKGEINA